MNDVNEHHHINSNSNSINSISRRKKKKMMVVKVIELCVRLFVIPLNVGSIWLTFTNKEDNITYGTLNFQDLQGLKYMICISLVSCGYALFAALAFSWINIIINRYTTTFLTKLAWLFFIADQVMAYLTVTSTGAVGEIVYLAYHGNVQVTWSETCTTYPNFCTRMKTALILHSFTLFSFFLLPLLSAFRLFTTKPPPPPPQTLTPFTTTTTNPTYTIQN